MGCKTVRIGCECDIDTTCLKYQGRCLDFIGVREGDNVTDILGKLNYELQNLSFKYNNGFIGGNSGGKFAIYKGLTPNGIEEFKTLNVAKGIKLTDENDVITFSIDEEYIKALVRDYVNELRI